jgi:hypothetical protein
MDDRTELLDVYRQLEAGELASQTFPGTAAANPIGTRQSEVQPGCYADKRLIAAAYADDTLDAGFIRLVRITQDATTGGVECRTEHFSLEHPPPYTALSYACGPRPADFNMKLNGRDWSVRQNLSHFLRQHLQMDRDPQEWLWIDAICINQANLSERTHQVRLMADIYGKASRVIVWLGAACEDSDAAMRGLLTSRGHEQSPETAPWVLALVGLCSRPYWHRLWVLQELKLANQKDLMCGSKVIPWQHFETFLHLIDRDFDTSTIFALSERTRYIYHGAAMRMIRLMSTPIGTSLWDLLNMSVSLQCEETRDRVYALCGLATTEAATIDPDYDIDMSVLLNKILRYHTEQAPDISIYSVASACKKLESMFETPPGTIFALHNSTHHVSGRLGLIYRRLRTRSIDMPGVTLLWAIHYDHLRAQQLIKMEHRFRSPLYYFVCGLQIIYFAVNFRNALRWKEGWFTVFLIFIVHLAIFFMISVLFWMLRWHGWLQHLYFRISNPHIEHHLGPPSCCSHAASEHGSIWGLIWWLPFFVTEGSIYIAEFAFRSMIQSFHSRWRGNGVQRV